MPRFAFKFIDPPLISLLAQKSKSRDCRYILIRKSWKTIVGWSWVSDKECVLNAECRPWMWTCGGEKASIKCENILLTPAKSRKARKIVYILQRERQERERERTIVRQKNRRQGTPPAYGTLAVYYIRARRHSSLLRRTERKFQAMGRNNRVFTIVRAEFYENRKPRRRFCAVKLVRMPHAS